MIVRRSRGDDRRWPTTALQAPELNAGHVSSTRAGAFPETEWGQRFRGNEAERLRSMIPSDPLTDPSQARGPRNRLADRGVQPSVPSFESLVATVYASLGRRPPALWWSKLEIGLGLAAVGLGLFWGREPGRFAFVMPPLVTLGGYLALAGHRSHLYDAMTRQTAATWARLGASSETGRDRSTVEQ